ncbi:hypothetical protein [Burkholderia plantarii]|uniref:Uncharacterized protein n=1 Tax=Burkholderia plantarii TaxID=41899 RepID=A0A0B6RT28_BURPL|nr:hypothetical protein [Burkholderia plantarii]AJK45299.1 hypothetical protein BGL_1c07650 [Burkholderia plantarii]
MILAEMDLKSSLRHLVSDAAAAAVGTAARCEVANFRWEQGVSSGRADEYDAYAEGVASHREWRGEHKGYLRAFVQVAKDHPRASESFMALNGQAHLREDLDNTFLLRLESLDSMLDSALLGTTIGETFWQRFFRSQKDLLKDKLSDSDETLRSEFVDQWNAQRTQARPAFATFLNEFGGDLRAFVKTDWPHILRDRLGLTHWPSTLSKPLPVALMCYTLDDVRQARLAATKKGAVASFSRPTVLDTEISTAFVPAPLLLGGESYGYTLDLADSAVPLEFTPELLTFPLEYQPRHIKALGFISRAHALQTDADMLNARNRHVQGLQTLAGCDGYGAVLI